MSWYRSRIFHSMWRWQFLCPLKLRNIDINKQYLVDIGEKVAIKAMQKSRISDYEAFQNEISILRSLVSKFFLKN